MAWWYQFSLPQRDPDITPAQRERSRYARLTSAFSLLILCISVPLTINTVIEHVEPSGPIVGVIALLCVFAAIVMNKLGYNYVAAFLLLMYPTLEAGGALIRNQLDPAFVPVFCALVVTIILAGSLMPPIFALLVALMNCAIIIFDSLVQIHTLYYNQMMDKGGGSLIIGLPIALQIIVGVVIYVIMGNLSRTLRRADRAEEIVALQKEVVDHQRRRVQDQQQLEDGINLIAQVYAAVAAGDLEARVPLGSESILWQVAVPLNNLLNRAQHWKKNSDHWDNTLLAIRYVRQELQRSREQRAPAMFEQPTETPVDLLIPEIYVLSQQAYRTTQPRPFDSR